MLTRSWISDTTVGFSQPSPLIIQGSNSVPRQICGDWPGDISTWLRSGVSPADYPTCAHGVMDPNLFKDAFWKINSLACERHTDRAWK